MKIITGALKKIQRGKPIPAISHVVAIASDKASSRGEFQGVADYALYYQVDGAGGLRAS
ncbi:MAG TPA: hypothetical protein VF762_05430 [Blastocatellia bacterium]|jgi:hypothetical protein